MDTQIVKLSERILSSKGVVNFRGESVIAECVVNIIDNYKSVYPYSN
jgi:hypothetical protein